MGIREPDIAKEEFSSTTSVGPATPIRKRARSPISSPRVKLFKPQEPKMDRNAMQTLESEKAAVDMHIAKYVYATNTPFSAVADDNAEARLSSTKPF